MSKIQIVCLPGNMVTSNTKSDILQVVKHQCFEKHWCHCEIKRGTAMIYPGKALGWCASMLVFLTAGLFIMASASAQAAQNSVLAAVLPNARSVQTAQTATAYAVILNTGTQTANNCRLTLGPGFNGAFSFQQADSQNNLIGALNAPADIPPGGQQNFVFAVRPDTAFAPKPLDLDFVCDNAVAPRTKSVNSFTLGASDTPVADILPIVRTLSGDGIVRVGGQDFIQLYAASAINIGASGPITVRPVFSAFSNAAGMAVCQSDPATGQCLDGGSLLDRPQSSITLPIGSSAVTFTVLVKAGSTAFWPEFARVGLEFVDSSGVVRASTSVALTASDVFAGTATASMPNAQNQYNLDGGWNVRMTPDDPAMAPFSAKMLVFSDMDPASGGLTSRIALVRDPANPGADPAQMQLRFLRPLVYDIRADSPSHASLSGTGYDVQLDFVQQGRIDGTINVTGAAAWRGHLQGVFDPSQGLLRMDAGFMARQLDMTAAHSAASTGTLTLTPVGTLRGPITPPDLAFTLSGDMNFAAGAFGSSAAHCTFAGQIATKTVRPGSLSGSGTLVATANLPRAEAAGGLSACPAGAPAILQSGVFMRYNPARPFSEGLPDQVTQKHFQANFDLVPADNFLLGLDVPSGLSDVRFGYLLTGAKQTVP